MWLKKLADKKAYRSDIPHSNSGHGDGWQSVSYPGERSNQTALFNSGTDPNPEDTFKKKKKKRRKNVH